MTKPKIDGGKFSSPRTEALQPMAKISINTEEMVALGRRHALTIDREQSTRAALTPSTLVYGKK